VKLAKKSTKKESEFNAAMVEKAEVESRATVSEEHVLVLKSEVEERKRKMEELVNRVSELKEEMGRYLTIIALLN
jgi:chromosomal replication initiation ATPase DnaA